MRLLLVLCIISLAVAQSDNEDKDSSVEKRPVPGRGSGRMDKESLVGLWKGRKYRKFGRGRKQWAPSFLNGASEESRGAVMDVIMKSDLDRNMKDEEIERILSVESQDVQNAFVDFKSAMDARTKKWEEEHRERISKLSAGAQAADQELRSIFQNETLSPGQKREEMKKVVEGLSKRIQKELKNIKKISKQAKKRWDEHAIENIQRVKNVLAEVFRFRVKKFPLMNSYTAATSASIAGAGDANEETPNMEPILSTDNLSNQQDSLNDNDEIQNRPGPMRRIRYNPKMPLRGKIDEGQLQVSDDGNYIKI